MSFAWPVQGTVTESPEAPDPNQANKHQSWEFSGSFGEKKVFLPKLIAHLMKSKLQDPEGYVSMGPML